MTEHPTDSATVTAFEAAAAPSASAEPPAAAAPRPGVPVWRVGKPDAFLAAAVDAARSAVREIAADGDIGSHAAVRSEGVRTVTHLFECHLPGYAGWQWFATLTRVSRSKDATVNEVGLLPTTGSILAPPWVPWAERVRPEDAKAGEPAGSGVEPEDAGVHDADDGDADDGGVSDDGSGPDTGSPAGDAHAPED